MREWLLETRKAKGMTQLEVADKLGITESYYSFIEKGERQKKMSVDIAAKLSVVFGIPVDEIIALEQS